MSKRDWILRLSLLPILAVAGCPPPTPAGEALYRQLQSSNPSDRIQGASVAVKQGDQKAVPFLVENLASQDTDVRLFSFIALKKLTGQTMGYEPYQPEAQREAGVALWRQWLKSGRTAASTQPAAATSPAPARAPGVAT